MQIYCEIFKDIGEESRLWQKGERQLSCALFVAFRGATRSPTLNFGEYSPPLITTFKRSVFSEGDLGTLCIKASLTYFLFKSQPQLTNENNLELNKRKSSFISLAPLPSTPKPHPLWTSAPSNSVSVSPQSAPKYQWILKEKIPKPTCGDCKRLAEHAWRRLARARSSYTHSERLQHKFLCIP